TIDDCWEGWAILLRQMQKKLIILQSETMIWQPEFTDKTLSSKPGAVQVSPCALTGRRWKSPAASITATPRRVISCGGPTRQ
ncbi:hypothetical protein, partial [Escherichia coli]|uniref:hypothetical protein n=1 Tax=Escherichia coli TaxID=562 RepID=UPI00338FF59C